MAEVVKINLILFYAEKNNRLPVNTAGRLQFPRTIFAQQAAWNLSARMFFCVVKVKLSGIAFSINPVTP